VRNPGQIVASDLPLEVVANGSVGAPTLTPSGTLFWSDDPEYLFHGVLGRTYQDRAHGRFRVFDYHVNRSERTVAGEAAPPYDLYVGVALTAPVSARTETYVYRNRHALGCGRHWPSTAQAALAAWLRCPDRDEAFAVLHPGVSAYLVQRVPPGAVAMLLCDFVATDGRGVIQPVLVTTYAWRTPFPAYPTDPESLPTTPSMASPPARATFPYDTLVGTFSPAVAPAAVSLGQNPHGGAFPTLLGEYQAGVDALDGPRPTPVYNIGNFGVVYRLRVDVPAGSHSVALNPRGGDAMLACSVGGGRCPLTSPLVPARDAAWLVACGLKGPTSVEVTYSLVPSQTAPTWLVVEAD
jgi:hypothetical protein